MVISGSLAIGLLLGFGVVILLKNVLTVLLGKSKPRIRASMSEQEVTDAHVRATFDAVVDHYFYFLFLSSFRHTRRAMCDSECLSSPCCFIGC